MLCQNKEATEIKIEPTLMYNVSILIERVILNWLITWKPQWPNVKIFDYCDFTPTENTRYRIQQAVFLPNKLKTGADTYYYLKATYVCSQQDLKNMSQSKINSFLKSF